MHTVAGAGLPLCFAKIPQPDRNMRQKRTAQVKAHITQELREQLEMFVAEEGQIISMSDYLFGVIEEHVAIRKAMRRSNQRMGARVRNLAG